MGGGVKACTFYICRRNRTKAARGLTALSGRTTRNFYIQWQALSKGLVKHFIRRELVLSSPLSFSSFLNFLICFERARLDGETLVRWFARGIKKIYITYKLRVNLMKLLERGRERRTAVHMQRNG